MGPGSGAGARGGGGSSRLRSLGAGSEGVKWSSSCIDCPGRREIKSNVSRTGLSFLKPSPIPAQSVSKKHHPGLKPCSRTINFQSEFIQFF